MKYIIKEQECGYLMKNGILEKLLFAGKYSLFSWMGYELKTVSMTGEVDTQGLPAELLMKHPEFASRVVRVQIPDTCIGLHMVNGAYQRFLMSGEALYWNVYESNEIRLVDVTGTRITEEQVPRIRVTFRNRYDGGLIPGTGIRNRFTRKEGETGWNWEAVSCGPGGEEETGDEREE